MRSERGAGVLLVDEVSAAAGAAEVSAAGAAAGVADVSVVVVVVVESVGALLFSVEAGSVLVVALFDIELSEVAAGVDCVVVVVEVSVDCATAAPMPASMAAMAATADNFF